MVIIAKARLLPASEASSLTPLARAIVKRARASRFQLSDDDPLALWFKPATAKAIRSLECTCRDFLVETSGTWQLEELSSLSATFYTALFSISRKMASTFRTANPTWMRLPKNAAERVSVPTEEIEARFANAVGVISELALGRDAEPFQRVACQVSVADATTATPTQMVDCVLTSPPYCTRIDYTAGTRVELALIAPLIHVDSHELRRQMIGTTMVPAGPIEVRPEWGTKCAQFLGAVYGHPSKASKGYYHLTHVDYFDKMFRSICKLSSALRTNGTAILIVQDSFYKDLHNDLPAIIVEMAGANGLDLQRRADFASINCMSRVNSRAAAHSTRKGSTESVLCFAKH